ncbi:DUF6891 domain-containing protein [Actinomadura terrae]|uniref:DUF6891 domain-containing protein n=1 Tax=Actinomadura terrae TaxID=604353 RepID=UPI001FA8169D|nr:hypothetical protein [Actinomadura terrae]
MDHERIHLLLALGENDFDGVVEESEAAPEAVAGEFAAYLADQRTWPEVTGTDRLLRAFRDLDVAGIVARADFACCQNCGISEIGAEVPEGEQRRGYVFCHRQDVERAVAGEGLMLAYGIFRDAEHPPEQAEIGAEVAEALRRHGLDVTWDGDPAKRVEVDLTWRRRRHGDLATWPGAPEPARDRDLHVTYHDYARGRGLEDDTPMTLAEARDVLYDLTPYTGNFVNVEGRTGGGFSLIWNEGPALWLTINDRVNRRSHGRAATLAEAAEMLTALVQQDAAALAVLGEHETEDWPG